MALLASPIVSIDDLERLAGEAELVIADVRAGEAYRAGHIPGAIHADLSMLRLHASDAATIAAWAERLQAAVNALGFGTGKQVIFYEDFSGTMAAFGVWLLDAAGLGNGAILNGGLRAWLGLGRPLATDDVRPETTSTPIQPNLAVLGTAGQILDALNGSGTSTVAQLVDTRGVTEFGMGSIPGAVNIEWSRNLDAEGRFRPPEDLAAIYENAGLDASEPVVTYCAGGFRAANTYVVLKALGYAGARNYAPSWGEWGPRLDTPVERHDESGR